MVDYEVSKCQICSPDRHLIRGILTERGQRGVNLVFVRNYAETTEKEYRRTEAKASSLQSKHFIIIIMSHLSLVIKVFHFQLGDQLIFAAEKISNQIYIKLALKANQSR